MAFFLIFENTSFKTETEGLEASVSCFNGIIASFDEIRTSILTTDKTEKGIPQ